MKKSTLASLITSCLAFVLFAVSLIFVKWDRNDFEATPSLIVAPIIIAVCLLAVFLIFLLLKKKNLLMALPVLGILVATCIFQRGMMDTTGAVPGSSIVDLVSPIKANPSLFAFILAVVFVVAVVLYFLKNQKWAAIVAVAYTTLLLIMAVINSVEIIVTDNLLYVFSASASIVAVVAVVFYFASAFEAEPEAKPAVENAPEAKEEKVEETKVEEAKEETTEAKENPYKSNFSSDSVFDVQDEEEKK